MTAVGTPAAKRLRDDAKDEAYTREEWQTLVDEALAAERKATVALLRAALGVPLWHIGPRHAYFDMEKVLAILDAEAAR